MNHARVAKDALTSLELQESLLSAMLRPDFYPKPPAEVTHKETHISHLFFAGELVYKVKKAVRYSFLDYSTLAKRRHFLQEELRLNRRLAPSVYLAVMPIAFDESGWRLGGWAEPAEYTLLMRRLPEKRMLPFLLETHQATAVMMFELADTLARFHTAAQPLKSLEPRRYLDAVKQQWAENLADIEPFVGDLIDRDSCDAIGVYGADFLRRHADLLIQRAEQGWIRDVHGDLHCEHICFAPEGIQIFDCIEFNAKLRRCDLAAEIAFLLMDLEAHGAGELAAQLLARYASQMRDPGLSVLLPFGKCYRALVRGKVYALRGQAGRSEAFRYFRYAHRMVWQSLPPHLIMVCGLTGSGKSTLARQLGERLGLTVINSDAVRKTIAGRLGRQNVPFEAGIYSPTMTERTYARMTRDADRLLQEGRAAILDATFLRKAHRQRIVKLADKHKVPLLVIHCAASESATEKRLSRRFAEGRDISDGRWEVFVEQKRIFEPLEDISPDSRLLVNTDAPLDQLTGDCEKFLRAQLAHHRGAGAEFG
jgi:aminoglycoside phosphotransferase family enzyme/predicted kinase